MGFLVAAWYSLGYIPREAFPLDPVLPFLASRALKWLPHPSHDARVPRGDSGEYFAERRVCLHAKNRGPWVVGSWCNTCTRSSCMYRAAASVRRSRLERAQPARHGPHGRTARRWQCVAVPCDHSIFYDFGSDLRSRLWFCLGVRRRLRREWVGSGAERASAISGGRGAPAWQRCDAQRGGVRGQQCK